MTQPPRPQVPEQPAIVVQPPPAQKRVNVGIRTILNQLSEPPVATRSSKAALAPEAVKRREKIARLAKELRVELDALAKLENVEDDR